MASAEISDFGKSGQRGRQKKKFGLVLQGGGAMGAYEVGAIECLYEQGMECAIVAGASSGAVNAVTLAGAKGYPPDVLKEMWREFAVDPSFRCRPWSGTPGRCSGSLTCTGRGSTLGGADLDILADNSPLKEDARTTGLGSGERSRPYAGVPVGDRRR